MDVLRVKPPTTLVIVLLIISFLFNYHLLEKPSIHDQTEHVKKTKETIVYDKPTISRDKIFISLASYRDPDLFMTIEEALGKATYPERLVFGIAFQELSSNFTTIRSLYEKDPRFHIAYVDHYLADGVGWSRHVSLNYYGNEKYVLMIDSHTRFAENWDELLIKEFEKTLKYSDKPLLSCYIADTDLQHNLSKYDIIGRQQEITVHVEGVMTFAPAVYPTLYYKDPQPWFFSAAGFVFTWGRWVQEVPTDPNIYFAGEEVLYSVRSYTHGYDIFYPTENILWHHYWRDNSTRRVQNWRDNFRKMWRVGDHSMRVVTTLLGYLNTSTQNQVNVTDYRYGFGTERTQDDWQIMGHLAIKLHKLYWAINATAQLNQQIIELQQDYTVETQRNPRINLFKGEKLLYAGTMTGGRYVVGRTFKCVWYIYAIPAHIVTMYKPSIRVSIGEDCKSAPLAT